MTTIVKLLSSAFVALAFFSGILIGDVRAASAATTTITCTGLAGATPNSSNTLQYNHNAGTCTMQGNSIAVLMGQFDITFRNQTGGNTEEFIIGTGGSSSNTAHKGCNLGTFNAAAGVGCESERDTNGTETETVTIDGENGSTIRMTISITIAGGGGSYTYNSASVAITTADASS